MRAFPPPLRPLTVLMVATVLAGCGTSDQEAADGVSGGPTLADFAGSWDLRLMPEGAPETVQARIVGTGSAMGWTLFLEGRDPIPAMARIEGDSLISHSDPYESVLRPGTTVEVRSALILRGDEVTGRFVATYQTAEGEEEVTGTIEGRREP
jgi:hypothetical protein